jgi:hypothetical protein
MTEEDFNVFKLPSLEFGADMRKLRALADILDNHITAWKKLAPAGAQEPVGISRMKSLKARMETALDLIINNESLPPELAVKTLIGEFIDITTNKQ